MQAAPTHARSPLCSKIPPFLSPLIRQQPHRALSNTLPGLHRCQHPADTSLPCRALTVGMAGQPHGGAARPGQPGVGCQVRSRVCRPAPGARQGWASRHHEVGVQTVCGAAGWVYPGKICQLLALSGCGGGKREREKVQVLLAWLEEPRGMDQSAEQVYLP